MMNDLKKMVLRVNIQKLIISKHPHHFINTHCFSVFFFYIILYDLLYLGIKCSPTTSLSHFSIFLIFIFVLILSSFSFILFPLLYVFGQRKSKLIIFLFSFFFNFFLSWPMVLNRLLDVQQLIFFQNNFLFWSCLNQIMFHFNLFWKPLAFINLQKLNNTEPLNLYV